MVAQQKDTRCEHVENAENYSCPCGAAAAHLISYLYHGGARVIIAAYDQMMEDPGLEELQRLKQQVVEGNQVLWQELKRRISGPYTA